MKTDDHLLPLLLYHFRMLGIKCNPVQLELVLKSAPSYPSLLSVMQTYTYFGIKTLAYRADFVKLKELLLPVVVQIRNGDNSRFVLLYQISGNSVRYYDASINRKITISDKTLNSFFMHVKENKAMEVVKVPFVWINRRELPTEYTPEDIPFLLTDLDNLQKSTM